MTKRMKETRREFLLMSGMAMAASLPLAGLRRVAARHRRVSNKRLYWMNW
ncbi:MAG: hypothetical protein U0528_20720 [Anaerolineae bacterium]